MRSISILINGKPEETKISRIFDFFIYSLIIFNFIAISLESISGLEASYRNILKYFELISVTIFTIEYLLRLVTAKYIFPNSRIPWLRYIFSFYGLIDLLAILPFYLPFLISIDLREIRIIRLFRLLRVLKLARISKTFHMLGNVFGRVRAELTVTIFVTLSLLLLSSTLMWQVEHDAQPEAFSSVFQAMWWAVATLTTVGYGDVYPITPLGKVFSSIIALLGIGIVALPTGILSSAFIKEFGLEDEGEHDHSKEAKYCKHCGEKI